jgi:hypothetical protein
MPVMPENAVSFGNVHALQIIQERVRSKNSSYRSYELNLVLKDGSRAGVVDHGSYEILKQDAEQIAGIV